MSYIINMRSPVNTSMADINTGWRSQFAVQEQRYCSEISKLRTENTDLRNILEQQRLEIDELQDELDQQQQLIAMAMRNFNQITEKRDQLQQLVKIVIQP